MKGQSFDACLDCDQSLSVLDGGNFGRHTYNKVTKPIFAKKQNMGKTIHFFPHILALFLQYRGH